MRGFSLVELSIVLVILGLLTGGILAGQSLIRAAELRSVATEVNRYSAAMYAFRDRYMALPGDMRNAVRFWGAQAGATTDGRDSSCYGLGAGSPATGASTCNGNGDGRVDWKEGWRAWQHLANAGLIEGSYTGVPGLTTGDSFGKPGENMPAARISRTIGYGFMTKSDATTADVLAFAGSYGHVFLFGAGNGVDEAFIQAEDAWNIDRKIDDGQPGTGRQRSYIHSVRPNCADSDDAATAAYRTDIRTPGCNLLFIPGL